MEKEKVVEQQVEGSSWRNRIVGRQDADPTELMAHPDNWRIHPQAQAGALKGVLDEVGFVQDVIVNLRTGTDWGPKQHHQTLLDGHLRVSLALQNKEPLVPVVYVDLDPEEEKLILATFDPLGDMAVPDRVKLDDILADVESQNDSTRKLLEQLRGESGAVAPEKPEQLPDIAVEGASTERVRCIIVFEDATEMADFYQRFGHDPETNKVLWRYADLAAKPAPESPESETAL